ncbi:MAG: hypothetical protein CMJ88_13450 [Planctomycetes bacterium]|nr:hypothetical protein [Planctomycetota bacterium]
MEPLLTLDDLAQRSGEKPRTIRSWIRQGLLPPARGGGRASYYDDEHLDRLLFVVALRKKAGARLPTSVVRDVLHQLLRGSDPDVVRRVGRGEESLEIADLFGAPEAFSVAPMASMSAPAPADDEVVRYMELSQEEPIDAPPRPEPRWTTIQLREDLELRLASDDPERVARLARIARRLRQLLEQEGEP